jgi:hypothetical protein
MSDPLDDLATDGVQAWVTVVDAWIKAVNAIGMTWLDFAAAESGLTGFNQEIVVVPAQQTPTALHPSDFVDWYGKKLEPGAVSLSPSQVDAGKETTVCVKVDAPGSLKSGTYTGSLLDSPGGTRLVDEIGVYVVGGLGP